MEDYIGVIRLFSGNFIPKGWMLCDGRELDIVKFLPLYSVINKTYGGKKSDTFAIPDLRGRVPVGIGSIDEKSKFYSVGEKAGEEKTILASANIPPLTGSFSLDTTLTIPYAANANEADPYLNTIGNSTLSIFSKDDPSIPSKPFKLNSALSNPIVFVNKIKEVVAVNNVQPVLGINYIICYNGLYPEREQ